MWEFSHKDNLVNFTAFLASLSDAWHILSSNLKHLNDQHVVQLQETVTLQLDLLPHLINTEIRKVNNTEIALDEPFWSTNKPDNEWLRNHLGSTLLAIAVAPKFLTPPLRPPIPSKGTKPDNDDDELYNWNMVPHGVFQRSKLVSFTTLLTSVRNLPKTKLLLQY